MRSPVSVLFQVFRQMLGKENVSGISATHDALCHLNSSAKEIGLIVHVRDKIDRAVKTFLQPKK